MNKFLSFLKRNLWNIIAIAIAVVMLVIDIITKQLVVKNMAPGDSITLIKGFLNITYTVNTGAAFGFSVGDEVVNRVLYCIIASLALSAIIFFYVWKNKKITPYVKITMLLIAAGALGNLIDRIFYSPEFLGEGVQHNGVVDWIDFCGIWAFIFNIADSCVVIGAIMLIVWLIVTEVKETKAKRAQEQAENNGKVLSLEEQERLQANNTDSVAENAGKEQKNNEEKPTE